MQIHVYAIMHNRDYFRSKLYGAGIVLINRTLGVFLLFGVLVLLRLNIVKKTNEEA